MERVVEKNNYNWRYERKFVIENIDYKIIEGILYTHPAFFKEIFHKRQINNIYLDTINYKNYYDHVDGSSNRIKIRIRWYNETFGFIEKPVLELKIRNGLLGRKESYTLESFSVNNDLNINILNKVFNESDIPERIKILLKNYSPSLLNVYNRKYFISYDKKFRITIDSDMKFYKIRNNNNTFLSYSENYNNTILEIKYDFENEKYIKFITEFLPFRLSKNSKYVNGLILNYW
ncbi:MAG: VTC domain-containing protein [bacterium]|nr:VTC domain-containing protein [bacterium]